MKNLLKKFNWKQEPDFMEQQMFTRIYAHCSQVLSFDRRTKCWAISSKDLDTRKWQVIGISIEETEAYYLYAKKLFGEE